MGFGFLPSIITESQPAVNERLEKETGEAPVLMLDDVMSELDPSRRRQLIRRLEGVQTLVTCTDKNDLAGAEIGKLYSVRGAVLTEEA